MRVTQDCRLLNWALNWPWIRQSIFDSEAVRRKCEAFVLVGVPLVEGTTGWNAEKAAIEKLVIDGSGTLFLGPIFYRRQSLLPNRRFCVRAFAKFPEYEAFIEERHH
jgi:hypothetical protein